MPVLCDSVGRPRAVQAFGPPCPVTSEVYCVEGESKKSAQLWQARAPALAISLQLAFEFCTRFPGVALFSK